MSKLLRQGLTVLATLLLTGCGTALAEHSEAYAQGWRRARVEAVVDAQAAAPRSTYRDCRQADHAHATGGIFVLASYAFGGSPNLRHTMIVRMPTDRHPTPGQFIRINVARCEPAAPATPARS